MRVSPHNFVSMKLVLKVPKGKPPFIGIEYEEYLSDRENSDLVKHYPDMNIESF